MTIASLRRAIYAGAGSTILPLGFHKTPREQRYVKQFPEGIQGVLELTDSKRGQALVVSLGMGFIVSEVEALLAEWTSNPKVDTYTTFGNVGYLLPGRTWRDTCFPLGASVEGGLSDIAHLSKNIALPFLDKNASLQGVSDCLEQEILPHALRRNMVERLPILYALMGNAELASSALAEMQRSLNAPDAKTPVFRWEAYMEGYRKRFPAVL